MIQLRQLYKTLGGRPSNLRKHQLVDLCSQIMQFSSEKRETSKLPRISASITDLDPKDINSRMISRSTSYNRFRQKTNSSHETPYERLRFPVGEHRNSRLKDMERSDWDVTFLGTASCTPSFARGVSCTALRREGDVWLFDCGESAQLQFQRSELNPANVRKIFITHCHGDHFFGLAGVLCYLRSEDEKREDNFHPLDIYGPEGTRNYLRAVMQSSYSRASVPYRVHELKNVPYLHQKFMRKQHFANSVIATADSRFGEHPGSDIYADKDGIFHLFDENGMNVKAAPMQHTVPCVGFVVKECDRLGMFHVEKAKPLVEANQHELAQFPEFRQNVNERVFKFLKNLRQDESFTFPNGAVLRGDEINGPMKPGRKVVIMGDTCNGEMIKSIATDADLLIHEATNAFLPSDRMRGKSAEDVTRETTFHGHSTPQMAAAFAQSINARRLVLTHFSPRYSGESYEPAMRDMWAIEDLARKNCHLKGDNDVIAAWDFMKISVPNRN